MTNRIATAAPGLRAAAAFYGPAPPLSAVPRIKAHLLLIYAEKDGWVDQGGPISQEAGLLDEDECRIIRRTIEASPR